MALHREATGIRSGTGKEGAVSTRSRLEVKDDGVGFKVASAMRKGRGLRNLKERAERIGGRLVVASEPHGGTLVRLEVMSDT
ncbi:MAG: hypothetical protein IPK70_04610 [Flavobacteriales bacterium]|jgi:signal transduction histidine kinase|nr:hypothetical protein [Flavobacteriales bacterium]